MDKSVYVGNGGIVYAFFKYFLWLKEIKEENAEIKEQKRLSQQHLMMALAEFYERFAAFEKTEKPLAFLTP
jgi:hypothetical protein